MALRDTIRLIPVDEINQGVRYHCSLTEAARKLDVSESALRRAVKQLGVKRVSGQTVRGGILVEHSPFPIVVSYSA